MFCEFKEDYTFRFLKQFEKKTVIAKLEKLLFSHNLRTLNFKQIFSLHFSAFCFPHIYNNACLKNERKGFGGQKTLCYILLNVFNYKQI